MQFVDLARSFRGPFLFVIIWRQVNGTTYQTDLVGKMSHKVFIKILMQQNAVAATLFLLLDKTINCWIIPGSFAGDATMKHNQM